MAELMQPVNVKIGKDATYFPNPGGDDVIVQVGDVASRDAGSHASVLVSQGQIVVSVWDGAAVLGIYVDRSTGRVTGQQ